MPLREFGDENHRTISSLPQTPPLHSAPSQNLLVSWWDQQLQLWRFNVGFAGATEHEGVENSEIDRFPRFFSRIGIKVHPSPKGALGGMLLSILPSG